MRRTEARVVCEERRAKGEQRRAVPVENSRQHLPSRQLRADREQDILRFVTFNSHGEPLSNHPGTSQSKAQFESARAPSARSLQKPCTRSALPNPSTIRFCDRSTKASMGPPSRRSSLSSSRATSSWAVLTLNATPTKPTLPITFSKRTSCSPASIWAMRSSTFTTATTSCFGRTCPRPISSSTCRPRPKC